MSGTDCWLKLDNTYTHNQCNTDRYILAYANSDGCSHANGYTKSYIHSDCDTNRDIHTYTNADPDGNLNAYIDRDAD